MFHTKIGRGFLVLAVLAAGCLLLGTTGTGAQEIKPPIVEKPYAKVKGIDPAVTALAVKVTKKLTAFEAEIEIIGVVRNIGTEDFRSGNGQQSAQLYEENPGARPRLVAEKAFSVLKSGEFFVVKYGRRWSTSMEFPPTYRLMLSYDPDIYIDGNKRNDDVNSKNNRKTLTGTVITEQVRKEIGAK